MLLKRGFTQIAGTDEVGRGPLAGPVIAACVILPSSCDPSVFNDSKTLSRQKRYELREYLLDTRAPIGLGIVSAKTIDQINILQASLLAMKRSIHNLSERAHPPDYLLVDGKFEVPVTISQQTLVKGDSRSATIGAASIVAKITRDELMEKLHEQYPVYHFNANKGYPTREHRTALKRHGPCPEHRFTFRGVSSFVTSKQ